jgi:hypothetical protein
VFAAFAAAGCTSDDTATRATSPWAQPGAATEPNPILAGVSLGSEENGGPQSELIASKHYKTYSWRRDKKPETGASSENVVEYPAPENPRNIRITGINEKASVLSFVCADTAPFVVDQQININDGKNAAYVRVVRKNAEKNVVVAELLPNQVDTPKLELGGELSYATTAQESAASALPSASAGVAPVVPAAEPVPAAAPDAPMPVAEPAAVPAAPVAEEAPPPLPAAP